MAASAIGRGKSKNSSRPPEQEAAGGGSTNNAGELHTSPVRHPVVWSQVVDTGFGVEKWVRSSRLSKTLDQVLGDRHCLSYLRQYLDSQSSSPLLEFWIHAENFHKATQMLSADRNKTDNKNKVQHSAINRTVSFDTSITKHGHDRTMLDVSQLNGCGDGWREVAVFSASCSNVTSGRGVRDIHTKPELLHEAIRIFKNYIALESPHKLDLPETTRNSIVSSICHPEGLIDPDIFKPVQDIAYNEMRERHFGKFLQSDYYCKYQVDILTSGSLTVEDIIFNEMSLFYFTEYLEQEHMCVILEFVLAVVNFMDQLEAASAGSDYQQFQNDAIILYDKYFSLQATSPLGFGGAVRLEVEENICREGGPLCSCFNKPFRLALCVLRQCVRAFTSSSLYYKYLSEMIGSGESSWPQSSLVPKHKKSYSDCSSEISVSARNTLLVMEDQSSRNRRLGREKNNMRIDSKQLYNGDLLWRRKTDKGLCLGRVNSLGRFESSMEPDPEKKDSSVIKRVVSRLVSGERDKAKEELAWQVAHMIVKDITDVTMGIPDANL